MLGFVKDGETTAPDGRALVGRTVRLDPARDEDGKGIFEALDHDEVWASGYSASKARPNSAGAWRQWIESALQDDRMMYVVREVGSPHQKDGRIIGTTSLGDIDLVNQKLHLGWTAYTPAVWGTSVNPECKLLLFWHAFEHCKFGRVKLRTDLINTRSQAAIAKLGATREGVARRHIRRGDGSWRSSVIFSVIVDEWPEVKAGLERRLAELSASPSGRTAGQASRES
jgi:RimJ/RimL family protein N-acetyltransferase